MKKMVSLLLALTIMLSLFSGCGSSQTEEETVEPTAEPTSEPTLSPEEMLYNSLSDRMKQAVDAGIVELSQLEATSKNYFLVIWAGDFSPEKVLKTPEYFVYCGVFKRHLWTERFVQSPKGEFLEVPLSI